MPATISDRTQIRLLKAANLVNECVEWHSSEYHKYHSSLYHTLTYAAGRVMNLSNILSVTWPLRATMHTHCTFFSRASPSHMKFIRDTLYECVDWESTGYPELMAHYYKTYGEYEEYLRR